MKKERSLLSRSFSFETMRHAASSSSSLALTSSSRPRLAPAVASRRPSAAVPVRHRRRLSVASAQQPATDARGAIDAGIDLMQAGDARAALAEFGRALTLPGTGLKRYRCGGGKEGSARDAEGKKKKKTKA